MSFREKSAWISFGCLLIFGGFWLQHTIRIEFFDLRVANPVVYVFGTIAALIALEIALHVAIAIRSPKDARTPKDERERLIDLRSSRVAFYVLLIGTFGSIGTIHIPGSSRFTIVQCMMGSIITALLVRFGTQIVLYRRDA